jgi:hypothetical protein
MVSATSAQYDASGHVTDIGFTQGRPNTNKEATMAKAASTTSEISVQVSVNEMIHALINFNSTMLNSFIDLLEKIETDLIALGSNQLQGEIEELLRLILASTDKSIETLLSLQQQLQTRIIESYFPAQD